MGRELPKDPPIHPLFLSDRLKETGAFSTNVATEKFLSKLEDRTKEMNPLDAATRGHRGMRSLGVRKNRFGDPEEKKRKAIKHKTYLANDRIKKKRGEKAKRQKRER